MRSGSSRLKRRSRFGAADLACYRHLYVNSVVAAWFGIASVVCTAQGTTKFFTGQYSGTVGGSPIRMDLQRQGSRVTGTYRYVRAGVSLRLEGALQENRARLQEIYGSQTTTGIFTAHARTDGSLEGTWTKPDGSGALSFYAQPLGSTSQENTRQSRRGSEQSTATTSKRREIPSPETRSSATTPPPQQRSRPTPPEETLPSPSGAGEDFLEAVRRGDTAEAQRPA